MTTINNKYIRLDKRPDGLPTSDIFSVQNQILPELTKGQFLIKNLYIAIDPALIGRIRDENNYAERVDLGNTMHAYCVGEVVQSRNDNFPTGQKVYGRFDMQEYKIADESVFCMPVQSVAPDNSGLSLYLGVLGITGATAHFGFYDICQPKKGECAVVSSAASSVGSVVGQLAKQAGCHTVGIVSTDEKARQAEADFGYDKVVSYRGKSTEQLAREVAEACPDGIDMYYDNTSGDISEALLDLYNDHARIAVVGRMGLSHLADTRQDQGRRDNSIILSKRLTKKGFVVVDYLHRFPEAVLHLKELLERGELTFKEDVLEGIDTLPEAFMRVVEGRNSGKQLVKLF